MTKTNTIIHLNGKSFDAVTGKPVNHSGVAILPKRSIDGVVRSSQPAAQPVTKATPRTTANTVKKPVRKPRAPAIVVKGHKPKDSQTLMRHAVHKPAVQHTSQLRPVARTDILAKQPEATLTAKLSVNAVDKRREARAQRVSKSKLVSRYGSLEVSEPAVTYVAPAPEPIIETVPVPSPVQHIATIKPLAAHRSPKQSMDIFQKALQQATSHQQKPTTKTRPHHAARKRARAHRLTSFSTAALAILLIGGFLSYQNIANVTLRMASHKAGFAATLPGYRPSGFSVGKFAYSPGNVTINFYSNSDSRHFAIAEQPSSWDSSTLLNNVVATTSSNYQTVQAAGRTVYVSGSKATWVNNGIWYQVDAGDSLNSTQLIDLASSM